MSASAHLTCFLVRICFVWLGVKNFCNSLETVGIVMSLLLELKTFLIFSILELASSFSEPA